MAPVEAAIQGSPQAEEDLVRFNKEDGETIDLVLRQFRCLIADLCQQFNGGHPGQVDMNNHPLCQRNTEREKLT